MPLAASFPDLPPPRKSPSAARSAYALASNLHPEAPPPSVRTKQDSSAPLYPIPLPSANSVPLVPPATGTQARLFHCHCAPKCVEFVKPRDHRELQWIGQVNQPLRTSVVAAGPSAHPNQGKSRTKLADFDVDSKVAYEFNRVGFYDELLAQLDRSHDELMISNTRAQQFLHATRLKTPLRDYNAPAYVPYYPSQHLASRGQAFVARAPLADAHSVADSIAAPTVTIREEDRERDATGAGGEHPVFPASHWSRYLPVAKDLMFDAPPPAAREREREALAAAAAAVIASSAAAAASTPRNASGGDDEEEHKSVAPASSRDGGDVDPQAVSAAVASARARLAQERLKFAEQMREQLTAQMSIPSQQRQQQQQQAQSEQF
jgi:hypothetical protein